MTTVPPDVDISCGCAFVIIIIVTRPWPAFGRHGLAGSSGGDQFWRKKLLTFSLAPSALRSVGIDHREVISFHMYN